jgi:recombination protein RecA
VQQNIVEKSGAWYSYGGERIGQGRENARQFLKDNAETCSKLDREVRKQLGMIRETTNGSPEPVETAPPPKTAAVPASRAPR